MDRRKLLLAPIVFAVLSFHKKVQASTGAISGIKNFFTPKMIQLGRQPAYMALAGKIFVLPENPKHGEKYTFSVDCKSLEKPCQVIDKKYSIVGGKEPFILDTLAIFSLTFNSHTGNWEINGSPDTNPVIV